MKMADSRMLFRVCKSICTESSRNILSTHLAPCYLRSRSYSTLVDENEQSEEDNGLEEKRNVSRLRPYVRARMEHALEVPTGIYKHHFERKHLRSVVAWHGLSSDIDPAIAWPTKEELAEIVDDEKEWEPTLQERWAQIEAKRSQEAIEWQQREDEVAKQMANMPKYIEAFKKQLKKKDDEELKLEEKRNALLEEAREYFGYKIDPRDPRFEEMKERKAEEEALEKKRRRKEEKRMKNLGLKL